VFALDVPATPCLVSAGDWQQIKPSSSNCDSWTSVAATSTAAGVTPVVDTVWIGCAQTGGGVGSDGLWRVSVTGPLPGSVSRLGVGATAGQVSNVVWGTSPGVTWWHTDPTPQGESTPADGLGGQNYVSAQLAVDPSNPDTVISAGKAGMWRTETATTSAPLWRPAVKGYAGTLNPRIVVDRNNRQDIAVSDEDWALLLSDSGLTTEPQMQDPSLQPFQETARGLAYDPFASSPTPLYATGDTRYFTSNPNPFGGAAWSSSTLPAAPTADVAVGLAVGKDSTGNKISVMVLHVDPSSTTGGLYRSINGGTFQNMLAAGQPIGTSDVSKDRVDLIWVPNSQTVFLYDQAKGLFRSANAGSTWSQLTMSASAPRFTGYISFATNINALYLSVGVASPSNDAGIYRMSNATSCAVATCSGAANYVQIGGASAPVRPGPIAAQPDGTVWAAQGANADGASAGPVRLLKATPTGTTWNDVTDDLYLDGALRPQQMTTAFCGPAPGVVCAATATAGNGVFISTN